MHSEQLLTQIQNTVDHQLHHYVKKQVQQVIQKRFTQNLYGQRCDSQQIKTVDQEIDKIQTIQIIKLYNDTCQSHVEEMKIFQEKINILNLEKQKLKEQVRKQKQNTIRIAQQNKQLQQLYNQLKKQKDQIQTEDTILKDKYINLQSQLNTYKNQQKDYNDKYHQQQIFFEQKQNQMHGQIKVLKKQIQKHQFHEIKFKAQIQQLQNKLNNQNSFKQIQNLTEIKQLYGIIINHTKTIEFMESQVQDTSNTIKSLLLINKCNKQYIYQLIRIIENYKINRQQQQIQIQQLQKLSQNEGLYFQTQDEIDRLIVLLLDQLERSRINYDQNKDVVKVLQQIINKLSIEKSKWIKEKVSMEEKQSILTNQNYLMYQDNQILVQQMTDFLQKKTQLEQQKVQLNLEKCQKQSQIQSLSQQLEKQSFDMQLNKQQIESMHKNCFQYIKRLQFLQRQNKEMIGKINLWKSTIKMLNKQNIYTSDQKYVDISLLEQLVQKNHNCSIQLQNINQIKQNQQIQIELMQDQLKDKKIIIDTMQETINDKQLKLLTLQKQIQVQSQISITKIQQLQNNIYNQKQIQNKTVYCQTEKQQLYYSNQNQQIINQTLSLSNSKINALNINSHINQNYHNTLKTEQTCLKNQKRGSIYKLNEIINYIVNYIKGYTGNGLRKLCWITSNKTTTQMQKILSQRNMRLKYENIQYIRHLCNIDSKCAHLINDFEHIMEYYFINVQQQ